MKPGEEARHFVTSVEYLLGCCFQQFNDSTILVRQFERSKALVGSQKIMKNP